MNPLKPVARMAGMAHVFATAFHKAYRIDTLIEPKREILPRYINVFCTKLGKVFDITVEPVNDIPTHHALWVSNHVSWLDIPVVGSVCPAFFIAKYEVKQMPIIGQLSHACGSLFIKRGSGDAGSISEQIADFIGNKHYPVVFFPEGTTTDGKQVKKLHSKLFQAAVDTGVQVQPLVLCYVDDKKRLDPRIPFIGEISFPAHLMKMFQNKPLTAYVMALDAIDPAGHTKESLTALVQDNMDAGLKKLHAQVLAA